jgi:hypothetical protein
MILLGLVIQLTWKDVNFLTQTTNDATHQGEPALYYLEIQSRGAFYAGE